MEATSNAWTPAVEVDMLIRRPVRDVWEAFVDPDQIRRFWLGRSTGRLETGAVVTWALRSTVPRPT